MQAGYLSKDLRIGRRLIHYRNGCFFPLQLCPVDVFSGDNALTPIYQYMEWGIYLRIFAGSCEIEIFLMAKRFTGCPVLNPVFVILVHTQKECYHGNDAAKTTYDVFPVRKVKQAYRGYADGSKTDDALHPLIARLAGSTLPAVPLNLIV